MLQMAVDRSAVLDRDGLILDIPGDPRGALDRQLAHRYRSVDRARYAGHLGFHRSADPAVRALHQVAAIDVAIDAAIDVQIGGGGDIAGDDDVGPEHRKHAALAAGSLRRRGRQAGSGIAATVVAVEYRHQITPPVSIPANR